MCGIAGRYNFDSDKKPSLNSVKKMIGALHHRGPDEYGFYIDSKVELGHARLSIIDLNSGAQPIHNEDKTLWIVYNGEVFNYPELRQELEEKGHRFYTQTDTEVVLHLYEEMGPACLEKLNGQFAIAIWDNRKKEIFMARDRVGIRPLHYTINNGSLIFASEIKSIFTVEEVKREIDPIAMDQVFTFWTTLSDRTAFKNIKELPPGHYLKMASGVINIQRYWTNSFCPKGEQLDAPVDEIQERIHDLLMDAVRIRLRADVPVGAYLSGGLDSSGVSALVAKNFNSHLSTFGIRFEEKEFDEGIHQNEMVDFLKTEHYELNAANEEVGNLFPQVLWHCEKPLLRTAPTPLYLLSRLVRSKNLKVVLTGEGADEIFGGYNIFREAKVRNFWAKQPDSNDRPDLLGHLYPYIFSNPRMKNTLRGFFAKGLDRVDDPLFSHLIRWDNTSKIKRFFSKELIEGIGSYCGYEQVKEALPNEYSSWDYLSKAQYLEIDLFLSRYLLSSQGDRVAMANSLEIRLPYLDPRIIEYMSKIPSRWKILGLKEKYILKKSFNGILPDNIVSRHKHPYRAPIKQSLLGKQASEYTRELLSDTALSDSGLFDPGKVKKLMMKLNREGGGSEIDNMALVGIISSQLLYWQYIKDFDKHLGESSGGDIKTTLFDYTQIA